MNEVLYFFSIIMANSLLDAVRKRSRPYTSASGSRRVQRASKRGENSRQRQPDGHGSFAFGWLLADLLACVFYKG